MLSLGLDEQVQLAQRNLRVGDHAHVRNDVLADLGWIDVDVHEVLDAGRERIEPGGDPVVAAHADHDQHVGVADRLVGVPGAHEPDHLERHRIRHRERAGAEQRPADGDVRLMGQLGELLLSARDEHAATGEDHRALGRLDELGDPAELGRVGPSAARGTSAAAPDRQGS